MKRNCPICNAATPKVLHRQAFSQMSNAFPIKGYDVVVCRECGASYADNLPDQKQLDAYYKDMSKYENKHRAGTCSDETLANYQEIVDSLKPFLPDNKARIADIGCATGALLAVFQRNGYSNLFGVDPSPSCAETAAEVYGIPIITSSLFDVPAPQKPFDLLVFSSVIEHIIDLGGALMRMRDLLAQGGLMFVEVPDTVNFATWISAPFQQFSVEHVNFFSSISLSNLMRRYGFEPVAIWHDTRSLGEITDPSLTAIFRKAVIRDSPLVQDCESESALIRYIVRSNRSDAFLLKRIDLLVASRRPILVWGTGTQAQRLLATTSLGSAQIRAFVDSNRNYHGQQLNGIPILAPEELHGHSEAIVITSRVFQEEIASQIRNDLLLENEVILLFDESAAL